MKTYSTIKAEIARLEKQAQALRKAEIAGVVARIKEAIKAYGLTAGDLGFGSGRAKAPRALVAKGGKTSTTVGVAKYRDPETGRTWTGRGKPPAWIAGVSNREAYLIDGPTPDTAGKAPRKRSTGTTRKARAAAPAGRKPKSVQAKRRRATARKSEPSPVKTAAVQMESGAASE